MFVQRINLTINLCSRKLGDMWVIESANIYKDYHILGGTLNLMKIMSKNLTGR